MAEIRQSAVYNSRILYMLTTWSSSLRAAFPVLIVLIFCCHSLAWTGDWDASEQQLAAKIVAVTGTGPATVEVNNRSSLGPSDVEAIRRSLIDHLSNSGVKLSTTDSATVSIQISLSENVQEYVWMAEIRKGTTEPIVVMISRSRVNTSGVAREVPAISLRKLLLWSSDLQILDAIVINGALPRMAVLWSTSVPRWKSSSGSFRALGRS